MTQLKGLLEDRLKKQKFEVTHPISKLQEINRVNGTRKDKGRTAY